MGKPTARTDLTIDDADDAARVVEACKAVLEEAG
jgi:hypothetical protein